MKITMRATYEELEWPSEGDDDYDEGDNYPRITGGFTEVENPWGGFDAEVPEGLCGEPFVAWRDENVDTLIFDDADPEGFDEEEMDEDGVWQKLNAFDTAARFIVDFPGAVWDLWEGESSTDFRTGIERSVTLHVDVEVDGFTRWMVAGLPTLTTLLDPLPRLFAEAERIQSIQDAHFRALNERRSA